MPAMFLPELHVLATIRTGSQNANPLPPPPEGRTLQRIWTLINEDLLRARGPIHNQSTFLEEKIHDYQILKGALHFYSRVVPADADVAIVLDYETLAERDARMALAGKALAAAPGRRQGPRPA